MIKHRGFVLVCVLWVLAILTVVTIGFGRRAMLDRRAAAYSLDHTEALMLARGAVYRGAVALRMKGLINSLLNIGGGNVMYLGQPWAQPIDMTKEQGVFKLGEEFGNDTVSCKIIDLCRFININTAPEAMLAKVKPLSRTAVRKILARRSGEEENLEGPVSFHSIDELRQMDGVDEEAWYGTEGFPPLDQVLTTWGDGLINMNTASEAVLRCIPRANPKLIEQMIAFRAGGDGIIGTSDDQGFSPNVGLEKCGITASGFHELASYCKFTSDFFRITGIATFRNGTVRAMCSAVVNADGIVLDWREESIGS